MKRWDPKFFCVMLVALTLVMAAGLHVYIWQKPANMQILFDYQASKLDRRLPAELALLGDSSLGNAVDAKQLSQQLNLSVLNLALTENAGLVGDYLLLKKLLSYSKPRMIVLMHTPKMFSYPIELDSYVLMSNPLTDVPFLQHVGVEEVWNSFFKVRFAFPMHQFWRFGAFAAGDLSERARILKLEDYYPQTHPVDINRPEGQVMPHEAKMYFLDRMIALAKDHKVPFVYMHPPLARPYLERSHQMLEAVDAMLRKRGVLVLSERMAIEAGELGDALDHVRREARPEFTRRIGAVLGAYL